MTEFSPGREPLMRLYQGLLAAYGEQAWWPAETPFEVAVGAVLTQNTAWSNVERAIANLKQAEVLNLPGLLALRTDDLATLIRPSGYFNIKAQRVQALCRFLDAAGGLEQMKDWSLSQSRQGLLSVKGVGPETADDILLYALQKPVFVIDTYTRRLLVRNALASGAETYEQLRAGFEDALPRDVKLFQQYHALIVRHAKVACSKRPLCSVCKVDKWCPKVLG